MVCSRGFRSRNALIRLSGDCRRLNAVTTANFHLIPRMNEFLDTLGDPVVLATLDANGSFWKVEINNANYHKTVFTSLYGLFRCSSVRIGLPNAPWTFQQKMDVLLLLIKCRLALVCHCDTTTFSCQGDEHISHVRTLLVCSHQAGVTPCLDKCNFFT